MIEKTKSGYQVKSESKGKDGKRKNLSSNNLTKKQALKRLQQVEFWKRQNK